MSGAPEPQASRAASQAPARADRLARLARGPSLLARWRLRQLPLAIARFVVIDVETTGPLRDRDRLVSIGAVGVVRRALPLGEAYGAVLRQDAPSGVGNILVHRIGGQRQLEGEEPAGALAAFLEFRGDAVGVAYRAEFDARVLEREIHLVLGLRARMALLDLAQLLPALFPGTAHVTLDEWCRHFGVELMARHDALGDAFATAKLLLIVLAAADRAGVRTIGDLVAVERGQRWLGRVR
jgi:DNA polymerase-3 subunit epsilon